MKVCVKITSEIHLVYFYKSGIWLDSCISRNLILAPLHILKTAEKYGHSLPASETSRVLVKPTIPRPLRV